MKNLFLFVVYNPPPGTFLLMDDDSKRPAETNEEMTHERINYTRIRQ